MVRAAVDQRSTVFPVVAIDRRVRMGMAVRVRVSVRMVMGMAMTLRMSVRM